MAKKKNSYAVIGLGRFGVSIVKELVRLGNDVIAIDSNEDAVAAVAKYTPMAYILDSTDEKAIRDIDITSVTNAIVCFGNNLTGSILTTVILKDLNIPHITVRMDEEFYIPTMLRLGANDVVTPQKLAGIGLANKLADKSFVDYHALGGSYTLVKITITDEFPALTLIDLDPRNHFGINIILIERDGKIFAPRAKDEIRGKDIIHTVGQRKEILAFSEFINETNKEDILRLFEKKHNK